MKSAMSMVAGWLLATGCAMAQPYPAKPVRLIMPFPPGGPTDAAGRLVAQKLGDVLGQQVVVETRAGASGVPGTEAGAKADPDGYTLLYATTSTFSVLPNFPRPLPYDPRRSFAPVGLIGRAALMMVVNADVPARTIAEFIALAKSRPGTINYASAGSGTVPHLAAEVFRTRSGVEIVHVPYKGSGPAQADLVAGRIQVMFDSVAPLAPNLRAGKLRALLVAGDERLATWPDVPHAAEAGLKGFDLIPWNGMVAPAGTPRDIVLHLNQALRRALADPALIDGMHRYALVPAPGTPEDLAVLIDREIGHWGEAVRISGAKLD